MTFYCIFTCLLFIFKNSLHTYFTRINYCHQKKTTLLEIPFSARKMDIWQKIILKIDKYGFWNVLKHILFEPLTSTWISKASLGELLDFQHPWLQLGAMGRYWFTQGASCDHIFWSMILVKLTRDRNPPKWWLSKGNPLISGKCRLVKYYNLARWLF